MVAKRGGGGGANCTLTYLRNGTYRAWRTRVTKLSHGLQMVATESRGPEQRAYYPHERTPAQFMLTFALLARVRVNERAEYERFNLWMRDYMRFLLDQDEVETLNPHRGMHVSIPSRNFVRSAIPLGPLSFGEHVGSMLWYQTITFEATTEPTDKKFATSKFVGGTTDNDRNARHFYPRPENGPNPLLSGNQKPGVYDGVSVRDGSSLNLPGGISAGTPSAASVNNAVTGNVNRNEHEARRSDPPQTRDRRLLE